MKEVTMTEQERLDALQLEESVIEKMKQENAIGGVEGMFAAAEDVEGKVYPIDVIRDGKTFFTFHVRPLAISEFEHLEKANRVFEKEKGARRVVDFRGENYLSMVIFEATTAEDKKEFWNNPNAKKQWGTIGYQTVVKVLKAGEIESIAEYIEKISGRENDLELGETVKN